MTKGVEIAPKFRLTWAPDPAILTPHFKLAAKAFFQPEFRISFYVQLAAAICQGRIEGIFDNSLLKMIRNIRDRGSLEALDLDALRSAAGIDRGR